VFLLVDRVLGKPEDGRYAELRRARGDRATGWFFWFFQAQAIAAVFFSLPALLSAINPSPEWHPLEFAALAIWVVAFAGEVTADRAAAGIQDESHEHRQDVSGRVVALLEAPQLLFRMGHLGGVRAVCDGVAVGMAGLALPRHAAVSAVQVTGIPATEAQALRSRGEAYRRYQQTTSAFVPWFPKPAA
jgi:steroid 5-alpha reductase family enzyme